VRDTDGLVVHHGDHESLVRIVTHPDDSASYLVDGRPRLRLMRRVGREVGPDLVQSLGIVWQGVTHERMT
jgi:hypothetical protein